MLSLAKPSGVAERSAALKHRTNERPYVLQWNLRAALSRAIDESKQSKAAASKIIESGDFKIDLTGCSAALRGNPLDLTLEEFDVLVFLASHPQSIITPQTLLTTSRTRRRLQQTEFLRALASLQANIDAVAQPGKRYLRTNLGYSTDLTLARSPRRSTSVFDQQQR